jgi:hypothetical protein
LRASGPIRQSFQVLFADDLDLIVLVEFFADRGLIQISLLVHEAYGRISELAGQNRCRILADAVPIGVTAASK